MTSLNKLNNFNTSVSIVQNKLAREETLQTLIATTGLTNDNLVEIVGNTSTTAQNSSGISLDVNELRGQVNITNEELKLLKKEDVSYVNFELSTIGSTLWADSVNPYLEDPTFKREGWYYVNSPNVGGSNVYWYSSDPPFGYKAGSELTLQNLTIDGGFYVVMWIDKLSPTNALPIFAIYTQPTGTDDFAVWHKSRIVYTISNTEKLYSGELVVLYNTDEVKEKIANIYPNARRVFLEQVSINGTAQPTEKIRFLSINGDSGALLNTQQWVINSAGWYDGLSTLNHYKFIVDTAEQSVDISGQTVDISGQTVDISGQTVLVSTPESESFIMLCGKTTGPAAMITDKDANIVQFPLPLLAEEEFEVIATNNNNTFPNGNSVRQVIVIGVDGNNQYKESIVNLAGVNAVSAGLFKHVNMMKVYSGNMTSGEIYCRRTSDLQFYSTLYQDTNMLGNGSHGWFMAEAGKKTVIKSINGSSTGAGSTIHLFKYSSGTQSRNVIYRLINEIRVAHNFGEGIELEAGDSIYLFQNTNNIVRFNIEIKISNL